MNSIYENDAFLEAFGGVLHPGGLRLTSRAARLAGISNGMNVLDIGCGAGATLEFLTREFGVNPYGLDTSEKLVGIARGRMPDTDLTVCDAAALPYEKEFFDAVVCECTLSLVPDVLALYSEIFRVLKPGGKLIVSDIFFCTPRDFEVVRIEEHKAALVTYIAQMRGAFPKKNVHELLGQTSRTTDYSYYLAVLKKSGGSIE